MLCYALPVQVVVGALGEVDAHIDVLRIEDVLNSELHLELKENVLLKIELDIVLKHYLNIEW